MTITDLAQWCLDQCPNEAQGQPGVHCGTRIIDGDESYWTFCGVHMAIFLDEPETP
jgi:hypothetical protein